MVWPGHQALQSFPDDSNQEAKAQKLPKLTSLAIKELLLFPAMAPLSEAPLWDQAGFTVVNLGLVIRKQRLREVKGLTQVRR